MYISMRGWTTESSSWFDTQTRFHTYIQYSFHCCIDIGVFISGEQWTVILSVKPKCLNPAWQFLVYLGH